MLGVVVFSPLMFRCGWLFRWLGVRRWARLWPIAIKMFVILFGVHVNILKVLGSPSWSYLYIYIYHLFIFIYIYIYHSFLYYIVLFFALSKRLSFVDYQRLISKSGFSSQPCLIAGGYNWYANAYVHVIGWLDMEYNGVYPMQSCQGFSLLGCNEGEAWGSVNNDAGIMTLG